MKYNLVSNGDLKSITVLLDGDLKSATQDHEKWNEIVAKVLDDNADGLLELFDYVAALTKSFEKISEQLAVKGGQVLFEGTPVDNALTKQIIRLHNDGSDFKSLALFMEKLETNPNEHSKEHLYRWLSDLDFTIAADGDFIGYKGVGYGLYSRNSGFGIVNGVEVNGQLDNSAGNTVEMPRDMVTFDPADGCNVGLHVGTWSYASTFATNTLAVKVNPRDVVSCPTDCSDQKLRVCRYTVLAEVSGPYEESEVDTYDYDEDVLTYGQFATTDTRKNYLSQNRDSSGRFVRV